MGTGGDWESLPPELYHLIVEKAPSLLESIRLSCVCKSWRAISDSAILHISKKNLPLLIVPYDKDDDDGCKKERRLGSSVCDDTLGVVVSLFHDDDDDELINKKKKKKKVYKLHLPEIADRRICGSSEGWLVTVHENSEIQLLNPITRVLVHLPPLTAFPEVVGTFVSEERGLCYVVNEDRPYDPPSVSKLDSNHFREFFLLKVVTNTTTTTTDDDANSSTTLLPTVVVMAIYGCFRMLAFCRRSSSSTRINNDGDDEQQEDKWISRLKGDRGVYEDVTFYKGNFYAVDGIGGVVVVKGLDGPSPFVETIIEREPEYEHYSDMIYLVECGGDLLMVMRRLTQEEGLYRTIGFRVFMLDFSGPSWVVVTNIDEDCALFIGYNRSFSFSASKFPGCKGNCIYFTDNNFERFYEQPYGGHDMGVFNLEDASFETFYEASSLLILPPPIWYELEKKKIVNSNL